MLLLIEARNPSNASPHFKFATARGLLANRAFLGRNSIARARVSPQAHRVCPKVSEERGSESAASLTQTDDCLVDVALRRSRS
jgi:hypothetical protein